jgi:hypothetical protein
VAVDGTKYEIYVDNLVAEYHIRYGGYGRSRSRQAQGAPIRQLARSRTKNRVTLGD